MNITARKQYYLFGILLGLGLCSVIVLVTPSAAAQVAVRNYQPQTIEEMIAYLYGVISQLETQINSNDRTSQNTHGRTLTTVTTLSVVAVDQDEATLRGSLRFQSSGYVYVWFEYGKDTRLREFTPRTRVTQSNSSTRTFERTINDLDVDAQYYYRAVAENVRGERSYGTIRSFISDERPASVRVNTSNLFVSKSSIERGDTITVDWSVSSTDVGNKNWIGVYQVGADNKAYTAYKYVSNSRSGEVSFTLNRTGTYEFRLFKNNGYTELATSRTVRVR